METSSTGGTKAVSATTYPSYLPPRWMVHQAAEEVVRRRLSYVPGFWELVQATPENVQQYLEWSREYALLALYPPSERRSVDDRVQRFGQAFPGLFNINGEPRAHDVRRDAQGGPRFIGALNVPRRGPLLIAEKSFRAGFHSSCVFRIERDASIKLGGFVIKSNRQAPKRFKYNVYFAYVVAFGEEVSPVNFIDDFESELVLHFGVTANQQQRQEIAGDRVLEGSVA